MNARDAVMVALRHQRTITQNIRRAAELGLIHRGRSSERVTGGAALARKHSRSRVWPVITVLLWVGVLLAVAWGNS